MRSIAATTVCVLVCGACTGMERRGLTMASGDIRSLIWSIPHWYPTWDRRVWSGYSAAEATHLLEVGCRLAALSDEEINRVVDELDTPDDPPWWEYDGRLLLLSRFLYNYPRTSSDQSRCLLYMSGSLGVVDTADPIRLDRQGRFLGVYWAFDSALLPFDAAAAFRCAQRHYGRRVSIESDCSRVRLAEGGAGQ